MCSASIGTDTGGSVRIPSALCGVVGLKPTYGRVSCHGVVPLSSTLDHVGPLTRGVLDIALVLRVIAGYDRLDKFSFRKPVPEYFRKPSKAANDASWRTARNISSITCTPKSSSSQTAYETFAKLGGRLVEVSAFPMSAEAMECSNSLLHAEATSFINWRVIFRLAPRIMRKTFARGWKRDARVLATDYLHALRCSKLAREDFEKAFTIVDAIVVPSAPIPAPRLGDETVKVNSHKETVRASLVRLNRPANLAGYQRSRSLAA